VVIKNVKNKIYVQTGLKRREIGCAAPLSDNRLKQIYRTWQLAQKLNVDADKTSLPHGNIHYTDTVFP
jgi:hypothetical protein